MCLLISCDSLQNRFVPFQFAISFCKTFSFPSEATLFSLKTLVIKLQSIQVSGTREAFFSHGSICRQTQKHTEWWKCALILMRQYYKHHWKTVLNLINNLLTNYAGTDSSNFHGGIEFLSLKIACISKPDQNEFSRFSFSTTQNPVLKFCPELETLLFRFIDEALQDLCMKVKERCQNVVTT